MKPSILLCVLTLTAAAQAPKPIHPRVAMIHDAEGDSVEARCSDHWHTVDAKHALKPGMTTAQTYAAFKTMTCEKDSPVPYLDPNRHKDQLEKHAYLVELERMQEEAKMKAKAVEPPK